MILLDTNVLSEMMRAVPDARVERWLARQADPQVFMSAITEAELRYGVAPLPAGRRRQMLVEAFAELVAERRYVGWPNSQRQAKVLK